MKMIEDRERQTEIGERERETETGSEIERKKEKELSPSCRAGGSAEA